MDDLKKENFKRISENRVKKITEMISKLHNLNNPQYYEYTQSDIDSIFNQIQEELDKQKKLFSKNNKGRRTILWVWAMLLKKILELVSPNP